MTIRARSLLTMVTWTVLTLGTVPGVPAQVPPRSVAVDESEVLDVFFAYIVGVLMEDVPMDLDGETLFELFPEFEDGGGQLPFDDISRVRRFHRDDETRVLVHFTGPVSYPVPVDILGYHPGSVLTDTRLEFVEQAYEPHSPEFGPVRLIWLKQGRLAIDFDAWLDVLLGGWVDDIEARVAAVARYGDTWYALLGGDTPDGGWITGVYDLGASRIMVRPPAALRKLGAELAASRPETVAPHALQ